MILTPRVLRTVEHADRRALGALQFVDAVTRLPVVGSFRFEVRSAVLLGPPGDEELILRNDSVQIQPTRSGVYAIMRAPFLDGYAETFLDPQVPAQVAGRVLRLRVTLSEAGAEYLPQEFVFDLTRSLDPNADDSVFKPHVVALFRSPGAPVVGGWSVLRVRVTQEGTGNPLPGVLVRVFRSPRLLDAAPIAQGMTEWRDGLLGEALVAIADLPRFRPGVGENVFETEQAIHFEAARDNAFTPAANQFPNVPRIRAGVGAGLIVRRSDAVAPAPVLVVQPAVPFSVTAGREIRVQLFMG